MRVYRIPDGATVEIDFDHQTRASHAAEVTGVELVGARTISYRPADALDFHRYFRAVTRAAQM
jgi:D-aminopeptidase